MMNRQLIGKSILQGLAISFALVGIGDCYAADYSDDMTTQQNGSCFEDSHIGSNSCDRVFSSVLTNGTYWQNDSSAGHYVGFAFNSYQKIKRYSIINVNDDPTLRIKSWRFQAETGSGFVDIDTQSGFTIQVGQRYFFDLPTEIQAKKYRLVVDVAGPDGTLITDIGMYSIARDPNSIGIQISQSDADMQSAIDLITAYNVAIMMFSIIFFFLWITYGRVF